MYRVRRIWGLYRIREIYRVYKIYRIAITDREMEVPIFTKIPKEG